MTTCLISFKNPYTFDHRSERGIRSYSAEEHAEFIAQNESLLLRMSVYRQ